MLLYPNLHWQSFPTSWYFLEISQYEQETLPPKKVALIHPTISVQTELISQVLFEHIQVKLSAENSKLFGHYKWWKMTKSKYKLEAAVNFKVILIWSIKLF